MFSWRKKTIENVEMILLARQIESTSRSRQIERASRSRQLEMASRLRQEIEATLKQIDFSKLKQKKVERAIRKAFRNYKYDSNSKAHMVYQFFTCGLSSKNRDLKGFLRLSEPLKKLNNNNGIEVLHEILTDKNGGKDLFSLKYRLVVAVTGVEAKTNAAAEIFVDKFIEKLTHCLEKEEMSCQRRLAPSHYLASSKI